MKHYWGTEQGDDNVTAYYITVDGDIQDTAEDVCGPVIAKIFVHNMYPGTRDDMRRAAMAKYRALKEIEA